MSELPYTTKLTLQNHNAIVLLCGKRANGESFFVYLEMNKEQMEKMARDSSSGVENDFTSYGKVLLSGEGEPSELDKQYMEEKYNFNHDAG